MTEPALAQNVKGKGRHYQHPDTGELVPSVTNVIDVLNKPAIPRWAAKSVAETAYRMRHSLAEMGEAEAVDMLKASPWQKSGRAADRGSSIHEWLEARALGKPEPDLSSEAEVYRPSAQAFLDTWQPSFVETEITLFGGGYAGTADFLAYIDGELVLGDYKTSKAIYPEVALQLAALAYAPTAVRDDGSTYPAPVIDRCVAVLITPDKHEVYPVDAGEGAYRAFVACLDAWRWRVNGSPVGSPWQPWEVA